jgi:Holliday junction resolvase
MSGTRWTIPEENYLREHCGPAAPTGALVEAAAYLGRSRLSVRTKVVSMGLVNARRKSGGRQLEALRHGSALASQRAKFKNITEGQARAYLEAYKSSRTTLRVFGRRIGLNGDGLSKVFRHYFPDEHELFQEQRKASRCTLYAKGRAFEYRVRDYLRSKGWWVLRSPRSGSPLDLVALKRGRILMVQCKLNGVFLFADRQELFDLAESVGAVAVMAARAFRGRGIDFKRLSGTAFIDVEILD